MAQDAQAWFRRRFYPHFDRRISIDAATRLVTHPQDVAGRGFLPFLTFEIKQPRYKPELQQVVDKPRPIAIASHGDAHIFAYYAFLLGNEYERALAERGVGDAVLAYRRFQPRKCNIHFAGDAFTAIEQRKVCKAIAVDIERFFDSIKHDLLKQAWCSVLGEELLPEDHYAVFKAVTRFARVDRDAAFDALGISRRKRKMWRGPMCSPAEFRDRIRGTHLISANSTGIGIPQGSPISALLSNVYMLKLDEEMHDLAEANDGVYRRYSDDIMLIGSANTADAMEAHLKDLVGAFGLAINDDKTARSTFTTDAEVKLHADRPLQYLGFTFDGQRVLVRSQTIAKYLRRMHAGIRSARRAAVRAARHGGSRRLRREELYERFSHLGPRRKIPTPPKQRMRGNSFWFYAKRASKTFKTHAIRRQLRRHWPKLNAAIELADTK